MEAYCWCSTSIQLIRDHEPLWARIQLIQLMLFKLLHEVGTTNDARGCLGESEVKTILTQSHLPNLICLCMSALSGGQRACWIATSADSGQAPDLLPLDVSTNPLDLGFYWSGWEVLLSDYKVLWWRLPTTLLLISTCPHWNVIALKCKYIKNYEKYVTKAERWAGSGYKHKSAQLYKKELAWCAQQVRRPGSTKQKGRAKMPLLTWQLITRHPVGLKAIRLKWNMDSNA